MILRKNKLKYLRLINATMIQIYSIQKICIKRSQHFYQIKVTLIIAMNTLIAIMQITL